MQKMWFKLGNLSRNLTLKVTAYCFRFKDLHFSKAYLFFNYYKL